MQRPLHTSAGSLAVDDVGGMGDLKRTGNPRKLKRAASRLFREFAAESPRWVAIVFLAIGWSDWIVMRRAMVRKAADLPWRRLSSQRPFSPAPPAQAPSRIVAGGRR